MRTVLSSTDLQAKMRRMRPKEGDNVVHSFTLAGTRYRLAAVVRGGQIVDWVALDARGRRSSTFLRRITDEPQRKTATAKTTCWRCKKAPNGDVHCVEITCPKGPFTPWDAKKLPT